MKELHVSAVNCLLLICHMNLDNTFFCLLSIFHHFTSWVKNTDSCFVIQILGKYEYLKHVLQTRDRRLWSQTALCLFTRKFSKKLQSLNLRVTHKHDFLPKLGICSSNFVHIVYNYSIYSKK